MHSKRARYRITRLNNMDRDMDGGHGEQSDANEAGHELHVETATVISFVLNMEL